MQLAEAEARLGAQQALFDGARADASRSRQNLLAAQDELAQLRTRIRGLVRCLGLVSRQCILGMHGACAQDSARAASHDQGPVRLLPTRTARVCRKSHACTRRCSSSLLPE